MNCFIKLKSNFQSMALGQLGSHGQPAAFYAVSKGTGFESGTVQILYLSLEAENVQGLIMNEAPVRP